MTPEERKRSLMIKNVLLAQENMRKALVNLKEISDSDVLYVRTELEYSLALLDRAMGVR